MAGSRRTKNAIHIAKKMARKGYADEGYVDPNDPANQPYIDPMGGVYGTIQGTESPQWYDKASDIVAKAGQAIGSPVIAGLRGAGESMNKSIYDQPLGYTEKEKADYPAFTQATEEYYKPVQQFGRVLMSPFAGMVGGSGEFVREGATQLGAEPNLARQLGREASSMVEWNMMRGDMGGPRAPTDVSSIPRRGEVLPPERNAVTRMPEVPRVIEGDTPYRVISDEVPQLEAPQKALSAPEPAPVMSQEPAPVIAEPTPAPTPKPQKAPKPPAPEPVRELNPLGFYSRGLEVASTLQPKASPAQYLATMKGVPKAELEGFAEHFADRPTVTREEVMDFFRRNEPAIEETVYGIPEDVQRILDQKDALREYLKDGIITEDTFRREMLELNEQAANLPEYKNPQYEKYTMNDVIPGAAGYKEIVLRNPTKVEGKTAAEWEMVAGKIRNDSLVKALEDDPSINHPSYDHQEFLDKDPAYKKAMKNLAKARGLDSEGTYDSHHQDEKRNIAHLRTVNRMIPTEGYAVFDFDTNEIKQFFPDQETAWDSIPEDSYGRFGVVQTRQGPPESALHAEELQSDYGQGYSKHGYVGDKFDVDYKKIEDELNNADNEHENNREEILYNKDMEFRSERQKYRNGEITKEQLDEFNRKLNEAYEKILDENLDKYYEKVENLQKQQEELPRYSKRKLAPFSQTDEWMPLAVRRLLLEAAKNGQKRIIVTPASEHIKRYGTDAFVWGKDANNPDAYVVGQKRLIAHNEIPTFENQNPSEMARHYNDVKSHRDLYNKLKTNLQYTNREAWKIAERIWKQIQNGEESGTHFPRAEGMEYAYQKMVKKEFKNALEKELGVKAEIKDFAFPHSDKGQHLIPHPKSPEGMYQVILSDEAIDKIKKQGFRKYQDGGRVEFSRGGDAEEPAYVEPEYKAYTPLFPEDAQPAPQEEQSYPMGRREDPIAPVRQGAEERASYDPLRYVTPSPSRVGDTAMAMMNKSYVMPYEGDGPIAGDLSRNSVLLKANRPALNPAALVVHHTAGRGNPEGVMNALNQQGYGVHYIVDRDGKVYASLPNNIAGIHTGTSAIPGINNATTYGVEVIANDDSDILPSQVEAVRGLYGHLQKSNPKLAIYGHGEIGSHKRADEGKTIVSAIRGGKFIPAGQVLANVPIEKRTLRSYGTGEFRSGGTASSSESTEKPAEKPVIFENKPWQFLDDPKFADIGPGTEPTGQTNIEGTLTGSIGTPVGGGRLSAYGGFNPNYVSMPKSPEKNDFVFPSYGLSWEKRFKSGGKVSSYPVRNHTDWEEAHDYEKAGGKLTHMPPDEYLSRVKPLNMDHDDKKIIHHFKKQMEKGEKFDPLAIEKDGHPNGRHRAHAAKKLGIKSVPVVTWPKKTEGGAIVDRALMLMSSKAKSRRGRPK